ncbi:ATP-binding protein [Paenibacillus sp. JCM 10914]|uniref:ATP-binding protein n=1 Tax=Paenibacillus sp. JCM 10914 TaxID=1236974 RepID=UPI0003CC461B|nr:ATP-binding protein [Paenibacillus sp. JCM 10914]GAE07505.1 hypothetical protein JCM10914_3737 [Paenibacillus sp. JCM 10914]
MAIYLLQHGDEAIYVIMDRDKMIQVLINLIRNAFQAMDQTGAVKLSLRKEASTAIVEVEDTGIGIDQESLTRIFDPFYTTKEEGTGLGLSLCQKIVEDHGGRITVQSERGVGTTFTIFIPIAEKK